MMLRYLLGLTALCSASSLAVLSAPVQAAQIQIGSEGPVIELRISETVSSDPELVTINAGVSTLAPSATQALRENAAQMQKVIDQIRALGVAEDDIATNRLDLNATFDYDRDSNARVFKGYRASNAVRVKLRDIDQTGAALDAIVSAGATDISGPTFSIEDNAAVKDVARGRALGRAKTRALTYARALGYDDIRVLEVSENLSNSAPMARSEFAVAAADAGPSLSPVLKGKVNTNVSVVVKFEAVKTQ